VELSKAGYHSVVIHIWLKRLLEFFGISDAGEALVVTDSQSCIKMIQNDKFRNRTKHIDTKYHFAKDLVSKGMVKLEYVATEHNVTDIFT
jgi:hypothetical protein